MALQKIWQTFHQFEPTEATIWMWIHFAIFLMHQYGWEYLCNYPDWQSFARFSVMINARWRIFQTQHLRRSRKPSHNRRQVLIRPVLSSLDILRDPILSCSNDDDSFTSFNSSRYLVLRNGFHIWSMKALKAVIEDLIEKMCKIEGFNPNLKVWTSWRWLSGIWNPHNRRKSFALPLSLRQHFSVSVYSTV